MANVNEGELRRPVDEARYSPMQLRSGLWKDCAAGSLTRAEQQAGCSIGCNNDKVALSESTQSSRSISFAADLSISGPLRSRNKASALEARNRKIVSSNPVLTLCCLLSKNNYSICSSRYSCTNEYQLLLWANLRWISVLSRGSYRLSSA